MNPLSEKLNSIEIKVRQLALKLERLQESNAELLKENKKLKSDIDNKNAQGPLVHVPSEKEIMRQVEEKKKKEKELKRSKRQQKELDQCIKEIDRCIEYLQNN